MPAGKCERCGTFRRWLHRHHKKPRAEGGTDADGVEFICANCHEDEHESPFGQKVRAQRRRAAREKTASKKKLTELYVEKEMSIAEIAKKLKTSKSNVQFWLVEYGIPRRAVGVRPRRRPSREVLVDLYAEQEWSMDMIGEEYGVTHAAVQKWLKFYEIPVRSRKAAAEATKARRSDD